MDDSRMNHLYRISIGTESIEDLKPAATKEDLDFIESLKKNQERRKGTIFENMAIYVPYD